MNEAAAEQANPRQVGERLRRARERAGISVAHVADQLRLSPQVVEALELGNFGFIGAQVFVRGYLRRYAELVGENARLADVAAQQHTWADSSVELTSTRLRALDGTGDRLHIGRWPLVAAAVLLCLGGIYWWAQRASAPRPPKAPVELVQEQVVNPPVLVDSTRDAPADATTAGHAEVPPAAAPAAAPAVKPAAAQPAAVQPAAVQAAAVQAPIAARVATGNEPKRHVRLSFHAESWSELYDASGARLFWGMGEPGDSQAVTGTPPFKLILGNPAGVTVSFEGTALALPAPRGGTTLRAAIDAKGAFGPAR